LQQCPSMHLNGLQDVMIVVLLTGKIYFYIELTRFLKLFRYFIFKQNILSDLKQFFRV
jgi:hypothetical protein